MKYKILNILILFSVLCYSQDKIISTEIKAENVFELAIIQNYPDSFPIVSVAFQAKNEFGKPLWTLDKSELIITENGNECEIIRLRNISKNKPLNIGIVFDHSGSMIDNPSQMPEGEESLQEYYWLDLPFPKGYVMAIEYEKRGVLNFLNESQTSKDSVLFIGFSSAVDKVYPLTDDFRRIESFVNEVEPSGSTAFFDALYLGIDSLSNHSSKGVIVALTDGQDNSSIRKFQEVIDSANEKDISIYIIGLGKVNERVLNEISKRTNGFYYHTNKPEKLEEIYLNIKEQIKSIYQVDYTSISQSYLEEKRNIRFQFVNDTMEFSNNTNFYLLPEETRAYLKEQEAIRRSNLRTKRLIGGFGILLFGIGSFLIVKNRRKSKLKILSAYPNPFQNELSIDFETIEKKAHFQLIIYSISGHVIKTIQINHTLSPIKINLEDLSQGAYTLQLSSSNTISNPVKVLKK